MVETRGVDERHARRQRAAAGNSESVDRGLATDAAARGQVRVSGQRIPINFDAGSKRDRNRAISILLNIRNLIGPLEQTLGEQKSRREVAIMPRGPHCEDQVPIIQTDLKGLFHGNKVLTRRTATVFKPVNWNGGNGALHWDSLASLATSTLLCLLRFRLRPLRQ